jgi:DNA-binding FadR family transcriptional regulator
MTQEQDGAVPAPSGTLRDEILALIRERGLRPGERLPTESEIARVFAVSRPKAREALRELESLGVVRSRQGSGRVLLDRQHHTLPALLGRGLQRSPSDVLDAVLVRQALEVGFLSSAMSVIDPAAIVRMRTSIDGMRARVAHGEPFPAEDRDFHDALFDGLHNRLLTGLLDNFWDLFAGVDLDVLRHRENPEDTIRHHVNIADAIEKGNFAVARFHLELHFYDSVESVRDFVARQDGG